jgi:hypothetical protein
MARKPSKTASERRLVRALQRCASVAYKGSRYSQAHLAVEHNARVFQIACNAVDTYYRNRRWRMKTYIVKATETVLTTYEVQAESEREAMRLRSAKQLQQEVECSEIIMVEEKKWVM